MKTNPLLLAGLAIAGLLLFRRSSSSAAVPGASARRTADYFNPIDLAGAFGRAVVDLTKGVQTSLPSSLTMTVANAPGISSGGLDNWIQSGGFAWGNLGTGGLGDPLGSWNSPAASLVRDPSISRYSYQVDAIAAAPVYDPTNDFRASPSPYEGISAGSW